MNQFYRTSLFGIFFCALAFSVVAEESVWCRNPERILKIASMDAKELIRIPIYRKWIFVSGKPGTGWADKLQSGKPFQLKPDRINLKDIASAQEYKAGEGVFYYEFESPKNGIAQLGVAGDWYLEVRCNGILCYSTMKSGNWYTRYSPMNHPFFFPVKKGKNLLAVHSKRGSLGWTFFCSPVPFVMPPFPLLVHPPTLMWPDRNCMSVGFLTCGKIGAGIEYRAKNEKNWEIAWDHRCGQIIWREFHPVTMTGLEPGVEYVYRAVMIDKFDPQIWTRSQEYTFRMPTADTKNFSFFFTADLQYSHRTQKKLLRNLLKYANAETCDFIVLGGDIGDRFDPEFVVNGLFPLLPAQIPLVYLRGNHELRAIPESPDPSHYYDYFAMPNGRSYGLFRFGNTVFMILDSWENTPSTTTIRGPLSTCKYHMDSYFHQTETNYIKHLFKSKEWTTAGKRIVLCHGAPYSHAGKMIPDFLRRMTDDDLKGKTPKSRLDLWVSGHIHFHTRSIPGTNELAAVGKPRDPTYSGTDYIFPVISVGGPTRRSNIKASAYRVDGSEKGIRVRAYSDNGTLLEDLFYANDGKLKAAKELKHYTVKPRYVK